MSERLEELKQEATELGIDFNPRIGEPKLQEKIDAYYTSQETSGIEVEQAVQAIEEATVSTDKTEKPAVSGKVNGTVSGEKTMAMIAKEIYDEAKKTRIVTITDNDQRVNNQTSTCKANWSNQFYDMGTQLFPLNVSIEVPQGFINVLKEVQIPHHVKDNATGLSITTMRNRYSFNYDDRDNS